MCHLSSVTLLPNSITIHLSFPIATNTITEFDGPVATAANAGERCAVLLLAQNEHGGNGLSLGNRCRTELYYNAHCTGEWSLTKRPYPQMAPEGNL